MPAEEAIRTWGDMTRVFEYAMTADGLRIGVGGLVLRTVPYAEIQRVERGWAPGWQVGGMGMPFRGDEVRVRVSSRFGLPWMSLTPDDPDAFVTALRERLAPTG